MFNQVIDNFRQATEGTVQLQQEIFKKWINLWPGIPAATPNWPEQAQQFQKKWADTVADLLKRQREITEANFKAGLANIQKAFQVAEAKTPEEIRAKSLELWQQCFDNLRKVYESQLHGIEIAMEKWTGLMTKTSA
jgi:hypothetical protein